MYKNYYTQQENYSIASYRIIVFKYTKPQCKKIIRKDYERLKILCKYTNPRCKKIIIKY